MHLLVLANGRSDAHNYFRQIDEFLDIFLSPIVNAVVNSLSMSVSVIRAFPIYLVTEKPPAPTRYQLCLFNNYHVLELEQLTKRTYLI